MRYEWDIDKAAFNLLKRGVSFDGAAYVFRDTGALTVEDDAPDERRFVSFGVGAYGDVLAVVYTYRDDDIIRKISARKATRAERKVYEEDL